MSKNNNPDNIVVVAVDVGSNKYRLGWYAVNGRGNRLDSGKGLSSLIKFLNSKKIRNKKLALGFEAPVFITKWNEEKGVGLSKREFELQNYEWYRKGIAIELAAILEFLLNEPGGKAKVLQNVTFDINNWKEKQTPRRQEDRLVYMR